MVEYDEPVTLTLAGIARLAGVGRAAVSNWRRRHDDFPAPVGGTDASPQFSLDDVEAWLIRHGKVDESSAGWERLWPRIEDLGDRDRMGLVVAAIGGRLAEVKDPGTAGPAGLTVGEQALVDEALRLAERDGSTAGFAELLRRWLSTHVRQVVVTPPQLADTMTAIAAELRGGADVEHVMDPACGVGSLLSAAARQWGAPPRMLLTGVEVDPVLAGLARARLSLESPDLSREVVSGDTLRHPIPLRKPVDVVLCNPPSNEREWGHGELATDRRWQYGQPPRTESELAWVQHILSELGEGGVAVVLLPPAVATRRAGRRIRAALVRSGAVRGVIALPAGAASPYGVSLHLWLLTAPPVRGEGDPVVFVDAADCRTTSTGGRAAVIDWDEVLDRSRVALRGGDAERTGRVPLVELLGDETDLTPARHVPAELAVSAVDLRRMWTGLDASVLRMGDVGAALRPLTVTESAQELPAVTVAELERSGAVTIVPGVAPPADEVQRGRLESRDGLVELLTAPTPTEEDVRDQEWLDAETARRLEGEGKAVLTEFGDVVVVVTAFGFDAWVETSAPRLLGPYLYRLRGASDLLDPFFLAACLRVPANARQAGTHASVSSRIDVRRLRVLRLPLEEQRALGEVHRQLTSFEDSVAELSAVGGRLSGALAALLAGGRLSLP
ncbi:HsdM family class I SAM-dependent methyltransferase [Streptomyces hydrogenans]|uniref:HsdM family class I SAM-dependent methyltransferase n=1 Tax=Streptomyces hydrogenans TaxID=1873719 RepID=UPI0035D849C7